MGRFHTEREIISDTEKEKIVKKMQDKFGTNIGIDKITSEHFGDSLLFQIQIDHTPEEYRRAVVRVSKEEKNFGIIPRVLVEFETVTSEPNPPITDDFLKENPECSVTKNQMSYSTNIEQRLNCSKMAIYPFIDNIPFEDQTANFTEELINKLKKKKV